MSKNKNRTQNRVTSTAKAIKDGADTVFDSVQNAVEATESAAMNAVDKTTDYINNQLQKNKER